METFKAIIGTGSPVSVFTKRDVQKTVYYRKVVIREMIGGERYVDYNGKPLELLGYHFVRLEVAGVTVSNARVLVAPNSGKFIVGRDWLVALQNKITQPIEPGECNVNKQPVKSNKVVCELVPRICKVPEVQQLEGEIPKLFKRKGRVKKSHTTKGRRIPMQLQNQMDIEIEKAVEFDRNIPFYNGILRIYCNGH